MHELRLLPSSCCWVSRSPLRAAVASRTDAVHARFPGRCRGLQRSPVNLTARFLEWTSAWCCFVEGCIELGLSYPLAGLVYEMIADVLLWGSDKDCERWPGCFVLRSDRDFRDGIRRCLRAQLPLEAVTKSVGDQAPGVAERVCGRTDMDARHGTEVQYHTSEGGLV